MGRGRAIIQLKFEVAGNLRINGGFMAEIERYWREQQQQWRGEVGMCSTARIGKNLLSDGELHSEISRITVGGNMDAMGNLYVYGNATVGGDVAVTGTVVVDSVPNAWAGTQLAAAGSVSAADANITHYPIYYAGGWTPTTVSYKSLRPLPPRLPILL